MQYGVGDISPERALWTSMPSRRSSYRSFLDTLCSEDKVLDLGGNIGTIATECALRGAQVMSYEPVPSNVARFQHHISMNGIEEKVSLHTELVVEAGISWCYCSVL